MWSLLRCDLLTNHRLCTARFQSMATPAAAELEAQTYGWTRLFGGLRCPAHRGVLSETPTTVGASS